MKKKGRWILLALVVAGVAVWAWPRVTGRITGQRREFGERPERVVPESLRIRVEVLNATNVRGLARLGTFHLRDLGFDVVSSGNSAEKLDSTLIFVRSGRADWAELAARALGGARIASRPDSSRYLDLTILLGASWRPPPEAFHP